MGKPRRVRAGLGKVWHGMARRGWAWLGSVWHGEASVTGLHIHTAIISYNRLELTKQCVTTYLETVDLPYTWVVVDNGSDPDTIDWLQENVAPVNLMLLGENKFPGFATNRGWEVMPPQTTLLHRSDNDFSFLPGWCSEVVARFQDPKIGQVGLRTDEEELWVPTNVGGNNVIRRELWDRGLRYREHPWGKDHYPIGCTEDTYFSPAVMGLGFGWTRVQVPCIVSLASGDWNDPYYRKSYGIRGIKQR